MTATWKTMPASEVRPGDRIRLQGGTEVLVSRIESPFLGLTTMLAFIEDTPERWYKQPLPANAEVEVQTAT